MKHRLSQEIKAALAVAVLASVPAGSAWAANHREAPLTALDPKADITDFFAFRSYGEDEGNTVTFILAVDPLLEPANGPNYFPFDPEILYSVKVDNDHDGEANIVFNLRFETEIRAPGVFTGFVGAGNGLLAPANSPPPVAPGTPIVPPAITALDGPGSAGLSLRQSFRVSIDRQRVDRDGNQIGPVRTMFEADRDNNGSPLIAVPSNVGPRTMPDYPALAAQGIYELPNGVRVFAGTADDPFWIDLGAAFDSLNFRPSAFPSGVPGVLTANQDARDDVNFAPDDVSGFNVNVIALQVPVEMLTADGQIHAADVPAATIGSWGTTARPSLKRLPRNPGDDPQLSRQFTQIQRMGNPLFNELIIGTGSKDAFSMSEPVDDAQFADFALDPLLARVLNAIYADALPIPEPPRTDLLPLVQYLPPIAAPGTPAGPVADLLRLNTGVEPTGALGDAGVSRLGLLAGDAAGYPNGRRVFDDVTDIAARAVVGVLAGAPFNGFPHANIGDGVNANDVDYLPAFPYVGYAHSGRNSRHVDPGEAGCDAGDCPVN